MLAETQLMQGSSVFWWWIWSLSFIWREIRRRLSRTVSCKPGDVDISIGLNGKQFGNIILSISITLSNCVSSIETVSAEKWRQSALTPFCFMLLKEVPKLRLFSKRREFRSNAMSSGVGAGSAGAAAAAAIFFFIILTKRTI